MTEEFDVIVIGGGHAGVEACLAAARLGSKTLLLTMNMDTIGQMSCNPAIGGLGKGHLVREIDALGGEMAKATEYAGIQFRMLNTKKGPAVQAPRVQCDKKAYQFYIKWVCEKESNLQIRQEQVKNIIIEKGKLRGVETTIGNIINSKTVVVTTGTFLQAQMHIGFNKQSGGRLGDLSAHGLTKSLINLGLKVGRLKTGTPPRLLRRSIDFSNLIKQPGEFPTPQISFWDKEMFHVEQNKKRGKSIREQVGGQIDCYITHTTQKTAEIIKKNIHNSPLYSGKIEGVGPRYCPSIEDKIVKFASKEHHQIFLEPEGVETEEIYVNGLSTSLPYDVQVELVQSVAGCERAIILRPAYAVEYDFVFPNQIRQNLETTVCENLFLAGQINGSSGYEEAGAQGLIAGINAALRVKQRGGLCLRRDQAYIGVLIDDLITKGTNEPYRMFTSRAEYRMLLRQDNADMRLSELGYSLGLLPLKNYLQFKDKQRRIEEEIARLNKVYHDKTSLVKLLSRPEVSYDQLPSKNLALTKTDIQEVEITIKYNGYIERERREVEKHKSLENKNIPKDFNYAKVVNISTEARQKLQVLQPQNIGQASRVSGVSPADITALIIALSRGFPKAES